MRPAQGNCHAGKLCIRTCCFDAWRKPVLLKSLKLLVDLWEAILLKRPLEMHVVMGIAPQANNTGTRFCFSNTAFAQLMYYPHQHRWAIDKLNDHAHWLDAD